MRHCPAQKNIMIKILVARYKNKNSFSKQFFDKEPKWSESVSAFAFLCADWRVLQLQHRIVGSDTKKVVLTLHSLSSPLTATRKVWQAGAYNIWPMGPVVTAIKGKQWSSDDKRDKKTLIRGKHWRTNVLRLSVRLMSRWWNCQLEKKKRGSKKYDEPFCDKRIDERPWAHEIGDNNGIQ